MIRRERIERQVVDYVFHGMLTLLKLEFPDSRAPAPNLTRVSARSV